MLPLHVSRRRPGDVGSTEWCGETPQPLAGAPVPGSFLPRPDSRPSPSRVICQMRLSPFQNDAGSVSPKRCSGEEELAD